MSSKRMLGPSLTSRQEVVQLLALTLQNIMFHTFHIFHMYDGDPSDEISNERSRATAATFWYISLPSSAKQREIKKFYVFSRK